MASIPLPTLLRLQEKSASVDEIVALDGFLINLMLLQPFWIPASDNYKPARVNTSSFPEKR